MKQAQRYVLDNRKVMIFRPHSVHRLAKLRAKHLGEGKKKFHTVTLRCCSGLERQSVRFCRQTPSGAQCIQTGNTNHQVLEMDLKNAQLRGITVLPLVFHWQRLTT